MTGVEHNGGEWHNKATDRPRPLEPTRVAAKAPGKRSGINGSESGEVRQVMVHNADIARGVGWDWWFVDVGLGHLKGMADMIGKFCAVLPLLMFLVGFSYVLGLSLGIESLIQPVGWFRPMSFNASLCFMLAAAVFVLSADWPEWAATLSLPIGVISLASLAQAGTGVDLHVEHWFFKGTGGMAPNTALAFCLIVTGIFWSDRPKIVNLCVGAIATIGVWSFIGLFSQEVGVTDVSIRSAFNLLLAALGLSCCPKHSFSDSWTALWRVLTRRKTAL